MTICVSESCTRSSLKCKHWVRWSTHTLHNAMTHLWNCFERWCIALKVHRVQAPGALHQCCRLFICDILLRTDLARYPCKVGGNWLQLQIAFFSNHIGAVPRMVGDLAVDLIPSSHCHHGNSSPLCAFALAVNMLSWSRHFAANTCLHCEKCLFWSMQACILISQCTVLCSRCMSYEAPEFTITSAAVQHNQVCIINAYGGFGLVTKHPVFSTSIVSSGSGESWQDKMYLTLSCCGPHTVRACCSR